MVASALMAGFAAGLIAALLQFSFVQPILLEAELYESGAKIHTPVSGGHSHDSPPDDHDSQAVHDHGSHDHDATGSFPSIDVKRDGLSVLFSVFVYSGYGLILVAAFQFAADNGFQTTARSGLVWGLAGFIAVQFAPAIGLPPELPGSAAADVTERQIWWAGTVVVTAVSLWLIAFGSGWSSWALAVVLLIAPHIIGAPQPDVLTGTPPPELAGLFTGRALGVGMAAWVCLGFLAAHFWASGPDQEN